MVVAVRLRLQDVLGVSPSNGCPPGLNGSQNAQTLGNLATECGFQLESVGIGPFGYDRAAATWSVRLRLGKRGFRLLRATAHLLLPASEVRLVARRQA